MSSSVKIDWNCSFNTLAFAQSDVFVKPELVLRVGMPLSSLCNELRYLFCFRDWINVSGQRRIRWFSKPEEEIC